MKNQLNKFLIVTLVILFFTLSKSYSIEDVTEFTDAINEAREEFNNTPEASAEQSKIIDEALKEIDKATEYAQEAINANNARELVRTNLSLKSAVCSKKEAPQGWDYTDTSASTAPQGGGEDFR